MDPCQGATHAMGTGLRRSRRKRDPRRPAVTGRVLDDGQVEGGEGRATSGWTSRLAAFGRYGYKVHGRGLAC
jgi:hypothetical protein